MTLQASGLITMNDIVNEFGGVVPHQINEYYRGGGYVNGSNVNIPDKDLIKFSDFYGARKQYVVSILSSQNFVVPAGVYTLKVLLVAGGGGGGTSNPGYADGGGGGGAGGVIFATVSVTPGQVIPVIIGAGGAGAVYQSAHPWGYKGGDSTFGSLTAIGGGYGGGAIATASAAIAESPAHYEWVSDNKGSSTYTYFPYQPYVEAHADSRIGGTGGSGGGACGSWGNYPGGSATSGQGNNGGSSIDNGLNGGGGGIGGPGGNYGGVGGPGATFTLDTTTVTIGGGGGAGGGFTNSGNLAGGIGGGGHGGLGNVPSIGLPGAANTGGGGGGGGGIWNYGVAAGAGGSGCCYILVG